MHPDSTSLPPSATDAGDSTPSLDAHVPLMLPPPLDGEASDESQTTDAAPTTQLPAAPDPTKDTYGPLQRAYDFFNLRLFDGKLPGAMITLRADKKSMGYFSGRRFGTRGNQTGDEIAMNPQYFGVVPIEDTLSTLVHELVHQHQQHFGKPGRGRYHNAEWGVMMRARGLEPSATGAPGGRTVGDNMSHYIIEGGPFDLACQDLINEQFTLDWFDRYPPREALRLVGRFRKYPEGARVEVVDGDDQVVPTPTPTIELAGNSHKGVEVVGLPGVVFGAPESKAPKSKIKYTCPTCKANAWGKPGLKLVCGHDQGVFAAQLGDREFEADPDAEAEA